MAEKRFYNEELKNRFLNEKAKSIDINQIKWHLLRCTDYEKEYDKDLCNWNIYEIIECYKMLNISVLEVLTSINSSCSQYTQFCLENNLVNDNQNHFIECTPNTLSNCINKAILDKKIISRETILEWVDELPNPRDQFILLSLFEFGKSKDFKDIVEARPEDLDKEKKVLKLSDREVKISNKLISIIDDCIETENYYSISGKNEKVVKLVDYGRILKVYPNQDNNVDQHQKGRNIYIACRRIFQYFDIGKYMNPNAIVESGKLHMIKERAKELSIRPVDYVYNSDYIREVENQFGCTIIKSTYIKKYEEYLV